MKLGQSCQPLTGLIRFSLEAAMFGKSSMFAQSRTRRAADLASTNGGLQASDAFKPEVIDPDAAEIFRLTLKLQEAQERLTRMAARGITKNHPDRLRAVVEFQEAMTQLSRLKGLVKAQNSKIKAETDRRYERAFIAVAREMLAGPVYDRLVAAALHRLEER